MMYWKMFWFVHIFLQNKQIVLKVYAFLRQVFWYKNNLEYFHFMPFNYALRD